MNINACEPQMKLDEYETDVLADYESGVLKPVTTEDELARIREAASATGRLAETVTNRPPAA